MHALHEDKLEDYIPVKHRELFDVWEFSKDGKGFSWFSETDLLKDTFSFFQAYANCCYANNNISLFELYGIRYAMEDLTEWLEHEGGFFEYRLGFWDPWDFITEDQIREYARQKYKSHLGKDHRFWLKRFKTEE